MGMDIEVCLFLHREWGGVNLVQCGWVFVNFLRDTWVEFRPRILTRIVEVSVSSSSSSLML